MKAEKKNKSLFMIIALSLLICMIPGTYLNAEETPIPIIYIDARDKTGTEVGETLWNSLHQTFPELEQKADGYLCYFVGLIAMELGFSGQFILDQILTPRADDIKANIDPRYRDEVNAAASFLRFPNGGSLGDGYLSMSEVWVLQLLPDIARGTNCSGFGVFGDTSSLGSPIVGRNMDWVTNEDFRGIQAITVYYYQDITLVNIGLAGLCGILTGFNSEGLFAGILDSSLGGPYPASLMNKRSYVFDLRNALETCTTISAATHRLYDQAYAFSHNILFADKTDVRVLENPEDAIGMVRTCDSVLRSDISWGKQNQISVVNFFALNGFLNGPYDWNYVRWARFKTLADFNNTDNRASIVDIADIMLDTANGPFYQIFNDSTVQSMVFAPGQMELYLYTIPITGFHDPFPVLKNVHIIMSAVPKPDLLCFAEEFGSTDCLNPTACQCDFDGDGDVDGADLAGMVLIQSNL